MVHGDWGGPSWVGNGGGSTTKCGHTAPWGTGSLWAVLHDILSPRARSNFWMHDPGPNLFEGICLGRALVRRLTAGNGLRYSMPWGKEIQTPRQDTLQAMRISNEIIPNTSH